jgi:hypothetical protein
MDYENDFKTCIESFECVIGDSPFATSVSDNLVLDTGPYVLKSSESDKKLLTIGGSFTITINTGVNFTITDLDVCIFDSNYIF